MAQTSLLQGKPFYCREWIFHKLQHCLQEKTTCASSTANKLSLVANSGSNGGSAGKGAAWGLLFVGGPGSGKTALCTELLWPSSPAGLQRGLHRQVLACHFCKAQDSDTLCVGNFIRALVEQICRGGLMPGFEDKLREPSVQKLLQPGECERNPSEAFKSSSSWHQSLKSAEEPPDIQRLTGRNLSFGFIPTNCHKRAFLASDLIQIPMSSRQRLVLGSHTLTRAGYASPWS